MMSFLRWNFLHKVNNFCDLKAHMRYKHNTLTVTVNSSVAPLHRPEIKCTYCDRTFNSSDDVKTHILLNHPKLYVESPELSFGSNEKQLAVTIDTRKHLHHCDSCTLSFGNQELLNNHMEFKHRSKHKNTSLSTAKPATWHQCEICNLQFSDNILINKHMKLKHTSFNNINFHCCEVCKTSYANEDLLINHMVHKHSNFNTFNKKMSNLPINDRLHECKICKIQFENAILLQNHVRSYQHEIQLQKYNQLQKYKRENEIAEKLKSLKPVADQSIANEITETLKNLKPKADIPLDNSKKSQDYLKELETLPTSSGQRMHKCNKGMN